MILAIVWWFVFMVAQQDGTGGFAVTSKRYMTSQLCEEARGVTIAGMLETLASWSVNSCEQGEAEDN